MIGFTVTFAIVLATVTKARRVEAFAAATAYVLHFPANTIDIFFADIPFYNKIRRGSSRFYWRIMRERLRLNPPLCDGLPL